jgi:hypoxanthine-DNA glycosylase
LSALLHGLPPVIGRDTRLLLLGSFPGAASLAAGQYYAHPRNQFWPLLSALLGEELVSLSYAQRLRQLREHGLGLWDVIAECRREGSLDSAIRDARYNDLASLRQRAPQLLAVHRLPSSSPAHASWSFERKLAACRAVVQACALPQLLAVAHNGGQSARAMPATAALGLAVHRLPSSSPAHASWSFERKLAAWRAVFQACAVPR